MQARVLQETEDGACLTGKLDAGDAERDEHQQGHRRREQGRHKDVVPSRRPALLAASVERPRRNDQDAAPDQGRQERLERPQAE